MKVLVKVFATLRKKYPEVNDMNPIVLEFEEGVTAKEIIEKLDFQISEIHLILLNGRKIKPETSINDNNSTLSLFPPIGGG